MYKTSYSISKYLLLCLLVFVSVNCYAQNVLNFPSATQLNTLIKRARFSEDGTKILGALTPPLSSQFENAFIMDINGGQITNLHPVGFFSSSLIGSLSNGDAIATLSTYSGPPYSTGIYFSSGSFIPYGVHLIPGIGAFDIFYPVSWTKTTSPVVLGFATDSTTGSTTQAFWIGLFGQTLFPAQLGLPQGYAYSGINNQYDTIGWGYSVSVGNYVASKFNFDPSSLTYQAQPLLPPTAFSPADISVSVINDVGEVAGILQYFSGGTSLGFGAVWSPNGTPVLLFPPSNYSTPQTIVFVNFLSNGPVVGGNIAAGEVYDTVQNRTQATIWTNTQITSAGQAIISSGLPANRVVSAIYDMWFDGTTIKLLVSVVDTTNFVPALNNFALLPKEIWLLQ